MKRVILMIMILILVCSGCAQTTMAPEKLIKIKEYGIINHRGFLAYDVNTKIIYIIIASESYYTGISPYYIIEEGKPTIAIYGVNYE